MKKTIPEKVTVAKVFGLSAEVYVVDPVSSSMPIEPPFLQAPLGLYTIEGSSSFKFKVAMTRPLVALRT